MNTVRIANLLRSLADEFDSVAQPKTRTNDVKNEAKLVLHKLGWSQRAAAKHLGYSFPHFNYVLNGHRSSVTLLRKIAALAARGAA